MFTKFVQYVLRLCSAGLVLLIGTVLFGPHAATVASQFLRGYKLLPVKAHTDTAAISIVPPAPRVIADSLQNEVIAPKFAAHGILKPTPALLPTTATLVSQTVPTKLANPAPATVTTVPMPTKTPTPKPVPVEPSSAPVSAPPTTVSAPPPPKPKPKPTPTGALRGVKVAGVLAYARAQLGEPYVLGGAGPSVWDCSGLTQMAFLSVGINIGTHSATNQYNTADARGFLEPHSSRTAGDLIFYTDGGGDMYHVAIYSGNGMMIEAPDYGKPVREVPVRDTDRVSQVARFIR
jgi:cell wall-associated NlpC family hydrolase